MFPQPLVSSPTDKKVIKILHMSEIYIKFILIQVNFHFMPFSHIAIKYEIIYHLILLIYWNVEILSIRSNYMHIYDIPIDNDSMEAFVHF